MKRYIAVDSGKYATKVACYIPDSEKIEKFKFRTKISDGNFKDDAVETATMVVEYEGKTYKIGNGAVKEAELNTSKTSEIHKICTLTAIAMCVSKDEVDEVCVAAGIPVKEWENVEKRAEYKAYIFPEGEISLKIMDSQLNPVTKTFKIVSRHVYPETMGALYLDNVVENSNDAVAIIDLGNLNVNGTYWNRRELDRQYSFTDELGGSILISGLSQELSAEFSRCDENYVAKVLKQPLEHRMLVPNRPNPEIEKRSKEMITDYLIDFVNLIKRRCDAKHWSLDFMTLVFIGGTSKILVNEIRDVFGEETVIPDDPEYANVVGFLRIMCGKVLHKMIQI